MRLAGRERLGFYSLPIPDAERIRRFLATRVRAGELRPVQRFRCERGYWLPDRGMAVREGLMCVGSYLCALMSTEGASYDHN